MAGVPASGVSAVAMNVTATRVDALAPRRQTFLKHALDYAEKGKINEKQWLDDLR